MNIPNTSKGLRLAKINNKDELLLCEPVFFMRGHIAVEGNLRRARISGRVEIGGKINNHFADILDENGLMLESVALDRDSYSALKNKWMRCKFMKYTDIMNLLNGD